MSGGGSRLGTRPKPHRLFNASIGSLHWSTGQRRCPDDSALQNTRKPLLIISYKMARLNGEQGNRRWILWIGFAVLPASVRYCRVFLSTWRQRAGGRPLWRGLPRTG